MFPRREGEEPSQTAEWGRYNTIKHRPSADRPREVASQPPMQDKIPSLYPPSSPWLAVCSPAYATEVKQVYREFRCTIFTTPMGMW